MKHHNTPRSNDTLALALIALFTVLAVVATGCGGGGGGGGDTAGAPGVKEGQAIFDRICATCHGKDANGLPKLGKGLRNNEFTKSLSDVELGEFLKLGRAATHPLNTTGVDMPPKGGDPTITEEDLKNVVAFLRTL
ncbi:MAG: cytochrome c [bacterium]|nr:cytochrome c [bacterium]